VSAQPPAQPAKQADTTLAAVPTDAVFFLAAKASKLWDLPAAKPLRDWAAMQKEDPVSEAIGVRAADVDRVSVFSPVYDLRNNGGVVTTVTTRQKYNEAKIREALEVKHKGKAPLPPTSRTAEIDGMFQWVTFADDHTLVFLPKQINSNLFAPNLFAQLIVRKADGPLASLLADARQHDFAIGVDIAGLAASVPVALLEREKQLAPLLVLLKAKTAMLTADFDKTAKIRLVLKFADVETAKLAVPALEEGLKTLAEMMAEATKRPDDSVKAAVGWPISAVKSAKVTTDGANVVATTEVPYAEDLAKLVATLPKSYADARKEEKAKNNIRQLSLAMFNYEASFGYFPGDFYHDGKKLTEWSWRVQILPYIEATNPSPQLSMTKAWNDPANLKKLEAMEMPKVFEHPGRPAPKGHTYFRIFTLPKNAKGIDRPFFKEGERGPRIVDITDGIANTFMIVEAAEAVPWYKPDVLAYDGKLPLPQLGDKEADLFLAAMGDGSVRTLKPSKLGEKTLRALITITGGEVIPDLDK
jgi:hypothetical protein